ncbi:hypothetical protein [Succinivibrio dextrinosolvens]|nr:hypothetical protein [Succinivibrio dextrinosolvens]
MTKPNTQKNAAIDANIETVEPSKLNTRNTTIADSTPTKYLKAFST